MNPDTDRNKWILRAAVFLPALVGTVLVFAYGHMGFMLPNINSAYGAEVDWLYKLIMYTVGLVFFGVESALVYFLVRYREQAGRKAAYTHGSHKAELIWTAIPGAYLIWLALYQVGSWEKIREHYPKESEAVVVQVFPQQYAWSFRYPGADGQFGTEDDVSTANLKVPVNKPVLLKMASKDVIHSLFLPFARVKQDVLPGMMTRTWFVLDRIPVWDPKQGQSVFLSEAEFNSRRIALKGYVLSEKVKDVTGVREYRYDLAPGVKTVKMWVNGKVEKVPAEDARPEFIFHHMDVACAELCGMNHYTMRAYCEVYPQKLFDDEFDGAEGQDDRWVNIWDKVYAKFNTTGN